MPEITQTRTAGLAARNIALAEQRSQEGLSGENIPSQESNHPDDKAGALDSPDRRIELMSPKEEE